MQDKRGTEKAGQTEEEEALRRPSAACDGIQIPPQVVPTEGKGWEAEVLQENPAKRLHEAE